MLDDAELLRRYAAEKSEAAFAEVVRRHLNLVYSIALRQVGGDVHLAEDVAQQVFAALARRAETLSRRPSLSGWLYRSTHFAASDVVRAERRRKARDHEALLMQSPDAPSAAIDWDRVRPVLDAAIADLAERDRDAVTLRFLDGRSFAEIGAKLQLNENTARMRVERALDKLHAALARRGVTSTTAAVGIALAQQASVAAPAGLSAAVTGSALSSAAAGGGAALLGLFVMNKTTLAVSGVVLALAITGFVELRANRALHVDLRAVAGAGDLPELQQESRRLNLALQKLGDQHPETRELARLQQRATTLRSRPPGVLDAALRPASTWSNVGRATPEAATETLHWAMFNHDIDAVAGFITFEDSTAENRAAFMAHFSAAVQARYRTPERLVAAAFFGAGSNIDQSPNDAFQFLGVDDHVGGNGSRFGQKRVRVWFRRASGEEREGSERWAPTIEGWAVAPFSLAKEWEFALPRLDPVTGDVLVPQTMSKPTARK